MTLEQLQDARVAVLQGGDSPEREVSLMSGASVEAALQELGVATIAVDTALPRWWNQEPGERYIGPFFTTLLFILECGLRHC